MDFLVVVDMQNDFIDGALGTREARQIVPNVVEHIRQFRKDHPRGEICVTRDLHVDDYLDTNEGQHLAVPHCIQDTNGEKLNQAVFDELSRGDYEVFFKSQFASKSLATHIYYYAQDDVNTIQIIGVCTDICVVSNALLLKAYLPEDTICVYGRCCAGTTPERHQAALDTMRSCQIEVFS